MLKWQEQELISSIPSKEWVITLGNFDGFHLGHQKLIQDLTSKAHSNNLNCGVLTFSPHPKEILNPSTPFVRIYDEQRNQDFLKKTSINSLFVVNFTKEVAELNAEQFLNTFLFSFRKISTIFIGYDFHFGKNRLGDITLLKEIAQEKNITIVEVFPVKYNGYTVSSTFIRRLIYENEFQKAALFLGKKWTIRQKIIYGKQRGRQLGFPTANVHLPSYLPLRKGVYTAFVKIDGEQYSAIFNFGSRPTVNNDPHKEFLECHILNFHKDIYHKTITIEPLAFFREEKKFTSLEELKENIARDIKKAHNFFKNL